MDGQVARDYELVEEVRAVEELGLFVDALAQELDIQRHELGRCKKRLAKLSKWHFMKRWDEQNDIEFLERVIPQNEERIKKAKEIMPKIGNQTREGIITQLIGLDWWYPGNFTGKHFPDEVRYHLVMAIRQLQGNY